MEYRNSKEYERMLNVQMKQLSECYIALLRHMHSIIQCLSTFCNWWLFVHFSTERNRRLWSM